MAKHKCVWCNQISEGIEWDRKTIEVLKDSDIYSIDDEENFNGQFWFCPVCREENDSYSIEKA
jgi:hypothetical protein